MLNGNTSYDSIVFVKTSSSFSYGRNIFKSALMVKVVTLCAYMLTTFNELVVYMLDPH